MTVAFITSLRSPQNATDYAAVEALLHDTLRSVTAQSDTDFIVIVVGNQRPTVPLPDRVHFVEVAFPAPKPSSGPHAAREGFVWDKGTKIAIGLIAARAYRPDFVMIFDADDFVSRSIVAFTKRNSGSAGWVITRGYMYSRARGVVKKIANFNTTCGTCFVIPYEAYGTPADIDIVATQSEVGRAFGDRLDRILGAHRDGLEWHSAQGRILEPLPFLGAVYHVDTGENHSQKALRGVAFPLTSKVSAEFGIEQRLSRWGGLAAAFGPSALAFTVASSASRLKRKLTRAK